MTISIKSAIFAMALARKLAIPSVLVHMYDFLTFTWFSLRFQVCTICFKWWQRLSTDTSRLKRTFKCCYKKSDCRICRNEWIAAWIFTVWYVDHESKTDKAQILKISQERKSALAEHLRNHLDTLVEALMSENSQISSKLPAATAVHNVDFGHFSGQNYLPFLSVKLSCL